MSNNYVVTPEWLHDHLADPEVLVLDATTFIQETRRADGETDVTVTPGARAFAAGHIPGAVHADLLWHLADTTSPFNATALSSADFATAIGELGVSNDSHVVVYDQGPLMWASRLWWNLRLEGHDRVSILDGGLPAWRAAGYDVATGPAEATPAQFTAQRRPQLLADKEQVKAAIDDPDTLLVNSLSPGAFAAARIPGSLSIPAGQLYDPHSGGVLAPEATRATYAAAGVLDADKKVIAYCGGGIAATLQALQLARSGREDVAVFDGSMSEWTADDTLPLERG